jgi:hypothetical protein
LKGGWRRKGLRKKRGDRKVIKRRRNRLLIKRIIKKKKILDFLKMHLNTTNLVLSLRHLLSLPRKMPMMLLYPNCLIPIYNLRNLEICS